MKKLKVLLSFVLIASLLSVCDIQAFAADTRQLNPDDKISEELAQVMAEADDEDMIPVWLWYEDVDQDEIDELTEKDLGYKKEESNQSIDMPDSVLLESLKKVDDRDCSAIEEYLWRTERERALESYQTNQYIMKRRDISRQKYTTAAEELISDYSLPSKSMIFKSQYAPVLIIKQTKTLIKDLARDTRILEINYYMEQPCEESSVESAKLSSGQANVESVLGLTGNNVKVGMVDTGYPQAGSEIDLSTITKIGNPVSSGHATNTATTLVGSESGFAKDITLYSTDSDFGNIETMITQGITLMNVSFGWLFPEDDFSSNYAYSDYDKWFDHIVAQHNVTVVASAGNDAQGVDHHFGNGVYKRCKRVLSPAMGHNVIAVGAFDDNNTGNNGSDDILQNYSSYKNSNGEDVTTGIEKPDIVLPSNLLGGGTSTAAPVLTALIAQILQLKPSLAYYPQVIKAIVLASCHRKALPSTDGEATETMYDGITERQGAGIPNAWTMAAIVSQGTYDYGVINDQNITVEFEQPFYGAQNLNVSLTWFNNNVCSGLHYNQNNLVVGQDRDLDLEVYHNGLYDDASVKLHSSTEMCYVDIGANTDKNHEMLIRLNDNANIDTKYGYAWSTNNMRASSTITADFNKINEGLYCIKNKDNHSILHYDSSLPQVNLVSDIFMETFSDETRWVIHPSYNELGRFMIEVGSESDKKYIGISNISSGTSLYPDITNVETPYWLTKWNDRDFSITRGYSRILSSEQSGLFWASFSYGQTIPDNKKWNIFKSNYIKGDANMDGKVDIIDKTYIQQYLSNYITLNNQEKYLSDINRDGNIDISDATRVGIMLYNNILY